MGRSDCGDSAAPPRNSSEHASIVEPFPPEIWLTVQTSDRERLSPSLEQHRGGGEWHNLQKVGQTLFPTNQSAPGERPVARDDDIPGLV